VRARFLAVLGALTVAAAVSAQDYFQWSRGPRMVRFASDASFDGTFNFCRLFYRQVRRAYGGQGWWTDYPDADANFMIRFSELTKARVSQDPDGQPNHLVLRADDELLFNCPIVTIEDAGTAEFSEAEVANLRAYLLKGGFLWADDFWGTQSLDYWTSELDRILPRNEFPVVDIGKDHPIFRMMFEFDKIPQIPSINHWNRSGGETSELGPDSDHVNLKGVYDRKGRLMVLMTHNTDIADAWEREAADPRYFYLFSPNGYAVGINVFLYAMSH
jgi:hypothetical protein